MRRTRRLVVAATAIASLTALAGAPGVASIVTAAPPMGVRQQVGDPGDESKDIKSAISQFFGARSAPGNIAPGAYTAAYDHVATMAVAPATWTEVTDKPYNADNPNYRDLVAGNSSGGVGFVTGRITGLAADQGYVYAGGAEGGVFRSSDEGAHWTPISDQLPALATGDLQINPADHSLWLATGEADFGDGLGGGVYRLANPKTGTFTTANRVGGNELESHSIAKIEFDAAAGVVFTATSRGVYKRSLTAAASTPWTVSLQPVNPPLNAVSNIANDVVVQPGTQGKRLVANIAYAFGGSQNGFYLSNDTGATWTKINPGGAINPKEIGVTEFSYSADGKKLYAVVESTILANKAGADTALAGVYVSNTGDVAGPYNQIANTSKLANSGSAMKQTVIGKGYGPGIQAWYNRFIAVDPGNANHVYVGLEEVYETFDAGSSWKAIGRYWNFNFSCWSYIDSQNTCDGNVVHPDQHSVAIGNGKVYVGNDGGLYSRGLTQTTPGWSDLATTGKLGTLQYYSVGVGNVAGGVAVWGGLQDNGHSLLSPADAEMVSPLGGDGGDQIVDPNNGCRAVGEYVNLDAEYTVNCGRTDGSTTAVVDINPLDPNPQFIAPLAADPVTGNWVAGGQFVYRNTKTWNSRPGAVDWDVIGDNGDFGAGVLHSSTAIASYKDVVWSGWCGSCSSSSWKSGIMTTYGTGKLHATGNVVTNGGTGATLPNRYVAGITIDPSDSTGGTAYAVYNGFSAHYVEGPGAGIGHVFKTTDGGQTWRDVSGSATATSGLPDVPASHLAITPSGAVVLTTDVGVFLSTAEGSWQRLGTTFPYTISTDVRVGLDGKTYVATYGRGIWSTPTPGATSAPRGKGHKP